MQFDELIVIQHSHIHIQSICMPRFDLILHNYNNFNRQLEQRSRSWRGSEQTGYYSQTEEHNIVSIQFSLKNQSLTIVKSEFTIFAVYSYRATCNRRTVHEWLFFIPSRPSEMHFAFRVLYLTLMHFTPVKICIVLRN